MLPLLEMNPVIQVQVPDEADCISHSAYTLKKNINLSILPTTMGK